MTKRYPDLATRKDLIARNLADCAPPVPLRRGLPEALAQISTPLAACDPAVAASTLDAVAKVALGP
jgi:hypothetical protein